MKYYTSLTLTLHVQWPGLYVTLSPMHSCLVQGQIYQSRRFVGPHHSPNIGSVGLCPWAQQSENRIIPLCWWQVGCERGQGAAGTQPCWEFRLHWGKLKQTAERPNIEDLVQVVPDRGPHSGFPSYSSSLVATRSTQLSFQEDSPAFLKVLGSFFHFLSHTTRILTWWQTEWVKLMVPRAPFILRLL